MTRIAATPRTSFRGNLYLCNTLIHIRHIYGNPSGMRKNTFKISLPKTRSLLPGRKQAQSGQHLNLMGQHPR
jgi:hypothetical protein